MKKKLFRILITPGEPAGIGPDVTIQIAQQDWPVELIAIADPEVLSARALALGLPLEITEITPEEKNIVRKHQAGTLKVIPIKTAVPVEAGALNVLNADYVLRTLQLATKLCLEKSAQAIVTGPVQKSNMQAAGIAFSGHTEFFAQQSGVKQTVMLFTVDKLKVALATTHLPLAEVSSTISKDYLRNVITILQKDLQTKFKIKHPAIAVCGINPHAGENGYIGKEEVEIIAPLIAAMQQEGFNLSGPHAADTAFLPQKLAESDAILAMYHDQALPVVKYLGFETAVNITLGLPFIRTSVDHGTALDLAGTGKANDGSMQAALELTIKLINPSPTPLP